jgi:hypothetical protein
MRFYILAVISFCFLASAQGAIHEQSIDVAFPDEVAGLAFFERKEFPQKELGVNIAYQRGLPSIVRGSVYIYNGGLSAIPPGTDTAVVRKQFAQVISEVKQLESIGKARAVNLSSENEQTTNYAGCGPQFIWRGYEIDLPDHTVMTSYTYLTGMKNNFVKLRVSHLKNDAKGKVDAELFVQQIRKVLGTCRSGQ